MSDWLGFSLTPQLRDGEEEEEEEQGSEFSSQEAGGGGGDEGGCFPAHVSVLPWLTAAGAFSSLNTKNYWRGDDEASGKADDGGPKFENFFGCCYSNTAPDESRGAINMNKPPPPPPPYCGDLFINPSSLSFPPWPCSISPVPVSISTPPGLAVSSGGYHTLSLTVNHPNPQPPAAVMADGKKRAVENSIEEVMELVSRKSLDSFGQRSSQYRGVTRHRWTGRFEAHLWDNSCVKPGQTRKGKQVYLGGYDDEERAAKSYDLAALKYWGPTTHINFPLSTYEKELQEMKNMSRQEFVAHLRRKSSGFSRGASAYRGVTRHHQHGRWQARIGRVAGNKDLYLGTFSTQEEAAEAYDIAAIKFRGASAITNFDISRYDVEKICSSSDLMGPELAKLPMKGSPAAAAAHTSSTSQPAASEQLMWDGGDSGQAEQPPMCTMQLQ